MNEENTLKESSPRFNEARFLWESVQLCSKAYRSVCYVISLYNSSICLSVTVAGVKSDQIQKIIASGKCAERVFKGQNVERWGQRGTEICGVVGSAWHSLPLLKPCDRLASLAWCRFPGLGGLTQHHE